MPSMPSTRAPAWRSVAHRNPAWLSIVEFEKLWWADDDDQSVPRETCKVTARLSDGTTIELLAVAEYPAAEWARITALPAKEALKPIYRRRCLALHTTRHEIQQAVNALNAVSR